jgi:hypothetical protein
MALDWIKNNVDLSPAEQRSLRAHANYFCAIHKYLDDDKSQALRFAANAILEVGPRMKYIVLIGKVLVGRKLIIRLFHGS